MKGGVYRMLTVRTVQILAAKVYHRVLIVRPEMYFLQILPCHASVIGKKDRTYKPGR